MKAELAIRVRQRTIRIPLGDGAANLTGGLGGWDEIERPSGRPLTLWNGAEALKVDVPIMLDGWPRQSVERQKDLLIRLGRRGDGEKEPPSFKVRGPVFFSGMRMVLAGIDFSPEQIIRSKKGQLLRLAGVMHLMEFVDADTVRIARRKKNGKFTYKTKKGDTVRSIARDLLGDVSLAKKIAALNNIRDTREKLEPGTVLIFPGKLEPFGPAD